MRENSFNQADEYEQYYVPSVLVYSTPLLLERAAPRAGERVLDVACRTGIAARMAAPMVEPTGEITGVDSSPNMLSVARRSSGNEDLEWIEGPAENLPFNDRSFDLVSMPARARIHRGPPDRAAGDAAGLRSRRARGDQRVAGAGSKPRHAGGQ